MLDNIEVSPDDVLPLLTQTLPSAQLVQKVNSPPFGMYGKLYMCDFATSLQSQKRYRVSQKRLCKAISILKVKIIVFMNFLILWQNYIAENVSLLDGGRTAQAPWGGGLGGD